MSPSRAADGMISNHGKGALAEAERRARNLISAGCYSAAVAWEGIFELIQGRIGEYALVGSKVAPNLSQTEMYRRAPGRDVPAVEGPEMDPVTQPFG